MPDGFGAWEEFGDDAERMFRENLLKVQEAYLTAIAPPPPLDPAAFAVEHIRLPESWPSQDRSDTKPRPTQSAFWKCFHLITPPRRSGVGSVCSRG